MRFIDRGRNDAMVMELAQIEIKPGMEAEFEAGVAKAAPIFRRAWDFPD